jgi:hypothetical protein
MFAKLYIHDIILMSMLMQELVPPVQDIAPMPPGFNRLVADYTTYMTAHGTIDPGGNLAALRESLLANPSQDPSKRHLQESSWLVQEADRLITTDQRVDTSAPWYERNEQHIQAQNDAYGMLERLLGKNVLTEPHRSMEFERRVGLYQTHLAQGGEQLAPAGLHRLGPEGSLLGHHARRLGRRALSFLMPH